MTGSVRCRSSIAIALKTIGTRKLCYSQMLTDFQCLVGE